MPMVHLKKDVENGKYELHVAIWLPPGVDLVENGINGAGELDISIKTRKITVQLAGEEGNGSGAEHTFKFVYPIATRQLGLEDYIIVESKKEGETKKKVALNYAYLDDAGDPIG